MYKQTACLVKCSLTYKTYFKKTTLRKRKTLDVVSVFRTMMHAFDRTSLIVSLATSVPLFFLNGHVPPPCIPSFFPPSPVLRTKSFRQARSKHEMLTERQSKSRTRVIIVVEEDERTVPKLWLLMLFAPRTGATYRENCFDRVTR